MTIYTDWMDRIQAPAIGEGHIRQLRLAIYPLAHGYRPGGAKTNMTLFTAGLIVSAHLARTDGGPRVTDEQADKGAQWLRRYGRKLGLPERFYTEEPMGFKLPRCVFIAEDWYRHMDGSLGATYAARYDAYYTDGTILSYHFTSGRWEGHPGDLTFTIKEPEMA